MVNNCIKLHCDQPAPRQYDAPMASNPHNPAMSPHTQGHPGTRHTVITVEREKKKRRKNKGGNGREAEKLRKHYH